MSAERRLADMLALIHTDPGHRGLATHPTDNLFTARRPDFDAACRSVATHPAPCVEVVTGFYIPGVDCFETDGPLGAWFLARALVACGVPATVRGELPVQRALDLTAAAPPGGVTHRVAVERSGPAGDGEHYTMRRRPVRAFLDPGLLRLFTHPGPGVVTVGVGDGGNEVGMGAVPDATIDANVPDGAAIHCRVRTDFLVVAGVSNWGAYALAAGVCLLCKVRPPANWFDPDAHRAALAGMVRRGPLVDGVTGRAEPTVDGLPWDVYTRPLVGIGRIVCG